MGSISMPQGKGSQLHNRRAFEKYGLPTPSNIDVSRSSENVTLVDQDIREAYQEIFGEALDEYNGKQKRADRRIDDYYEHIKKSKNGENLFYEDVVQWGDMKDFQNPETHQKAKEALLEYASTFQERNPNLKLIGAYLHMDEASPHLHIDYIPVAHGYSRGLTTRNSLDKAMKEMGFKPENESKTNNATKLWKESERAYFGEICRSRGLEVEAERKSTRKSLSVEEYKEARDEMFREIEQEKSAAMDKAEELNGHINALEGQIGALESKKVLLVEEEKKEGLKRQIRAEKNREKEKDLQTQENKLKKWEEKLQKEEKKLESKEKDFEAKKAGMEDKIESLNQQINSFNELPKGRTSMINSKKIILELEEYQKLRWGAGKWIMEKPVIYELKKENEKLLERSERYEELKKEIPTFQERHELKLIKQENEELKEKNKKLENVLEKLREMNLPIAAQKLIDNVLKSFTKTQQKEKNQEQGYSR